MAIRIVFLDLGGTLVEMRSDLLEDSAQQIRTSTGHPVSAMELKQAEREEWDNTMPQGFLWVRSEEEERRYWKEKFYPSLLQRLGVLSFPDSLLHYLAERAMDPVSYIPFPEVGNVLDELEHAGLRVGIISNSFPSAERILRHWNLERRFHPVILSHQVGWAKPETEIYEIALRRAGVSCQEALFVDDRAPLARGAKRAGIRTFLINRNGYSDGWEGEQIGNLGEILTFLWRPEESERPAHVPQCFSGVRDTSRRRLFVPWRNREGTDCSRLPAPPNEDSGARETRYPSGGEEWRRVYKVFLASPGDVLRERKVAYEVIEEVNRILDIVGRPYRLEVYAWEGRAHPDAGLPQSTILKQIPIEQCDIFIAIFWKRFGTPPGTVRPSDGRPYLSGTEQEIEEAFEARRKNPNERPIIMLYWKKDPLPPSMTEEEHLQCAKVIEFFRQCEPDGKHPTLVAHFEGEGFRPLFQEHLLQVGEELERYGELEMSLPIDLVKPVPSQNRDPMGRWLDQIGLQGNPFQGYNACRRDDLPRFFVWPRGFRKDELVNDPQPWVIFADEGCGKTTLRLMVEMECPSKVLCVVLGADEMSKWPERPQKRIGFIQPKPSEQSEVFGAEVIAYFVGQHLSEMEKIWVQPDWGAKQILKYLYSLAKAKGFERILCLVDEVDRWPEVGGEPSKMADWLVHLMAPELREVKGFAFRYFLPAKLEPTLTERRPEFRLDRCHVMRLQWEPFDLKNLLRQRLIAFSKKSVAPRQALGELCAETGDFAKRIEDELVRLAEGNPRAAVYLADQLFRLHCQEAPPPRRIRPETWDRVKTEWGLHGRNQIFGPPGEGFVLYGDHIYFNGKEVHLPPRLHALLCCLVRARGNICSRSDLARAGWPEADPAGVSVRAIYEAIRRLRKELEKQGISPECIETMRGRGYCIRIP